MTRLLASIWFAMLLFSILEVAVAAPTPSPRPTRAPVAPLPPTPFARTGWVVAAMSSDAVCSIARVNNLVSFAEGLCVPSFLDIGYLVSQYDSGAATSTKGQTSTQPGTPTFAVSSVQDTQLSSTQYSDSLCTRRISGPSTTQLPTSLFSCVPDETDSSFESMLISRDSSADLPTVSFYAERYILTLDPLCRDASKVVQQTLTAMPMSGGRGCNSFKSNGVTTYYKFACGGPYNVTINTYSLPGCQGEPKDDDPLVKMFWKPTAKACDVSSLTPGVYSSSSFCVPPGAAFWDGGGSGNSGGGGDSSTSSGSAALTQTTNNIAIGVSVAVLLLAAAAAFCYYYFYHYVKRSSPMAQQADQDQENPNPIPNPAADNDDVPSPMLGTAAPALPRASALVSNASTYLHHAPGRMTIIPEQSNPYVNPTATPTPTQPRLSGLAEKSTDEEL